MKIAIVILNWNGRSLMEQFLPSLIENTPNADFYVIDNASTDDSCAFLSEHYPQINQVVLDANYGFAKGYNLGLKSIDADLYCLLNNDVSVSKNWLAPFQEAFKTQELSIAQPLILQHKQANYFEYAGAAGGFIDRYGFPYCRGRIFDSLEENKGQYKTADCFWATGACMFIRRTVWEELEGFDEDFFMHQEEIDLCWRAFNNGHVTKCITTAQVFHLGAASLKTSPQKTFYNHRNSLWMLLKNVPKQKLFSVIFGRLILDGFAAVRYLINGQVLSFLMVIKAHFSVYASLSMTLSKRGQNKKNKSYYRHNNLPWKYFILKKGEFSDL
jgi:GT2 family glycosyltransferase